MDDSTIIVSNQESIIEAIHNIKEFGQLAGPTLNLDKTEGMWLGPLKDSCAEFAGIKFKKGSIKCLGIFIGHHKEENLEKNWMHKIKKIQAALEVWKSRDLTLLGKILIIKTLGLSKISYVATVLPCPESVIRSIQKLFYDFLWKGKDRIRRSLLINRYEKGGLKMPDVKAYVDALHASWVPRV